MEETEERSFEDYGFELLAAVNEAESQYNKRKLIQDYISDIIQLELETVTEFPKSSEWFNTNRPVSLAEDLQGKVVVLDFFTYCCINCMHILPDLHALEEKHTLEDGVAVVGVHSAKFDNEKLSANILSAVLRYDITHPVINDQHSVMWQNMSIRCWPTLVILSPDHKVLLHLVGEGHREALLSFIEVAVEYYEALGQIRHNPVDWIKLSRESLPSTPLLFPGKIAMNEEEFLAISDSGHHRILITDKYGVVQDTIGSGIAGYQDGDFMSAQFRAPQGLCWLGKETLFIADTENHLIRKVDLVGKQVSTITGQAGVQGQDKEGGKCGVDQVISSPWDVTLGSSIGSTESDVLFIAMAGSHQIWMYFLKAGKWLKGKSYPETTCVRFAGSGREENRNNSYPHNAAFAQPSGICRGKLKLEDEHDHLLIADAESSSIRSISLKDGAVKNVVGGVKDPQNLFAFGDKDGKGTEAKFQHPLAVSIATSAEGNKLYVADSYNHKVKVINLSTQESLTLFGTGTAGNDLSNMELDEPGGLCVCGAKLYIADTNNHAIKVYDLDEKTLKELPILFSNTEIEEMDITDSSAEFSPVKRITPKCAHVIQQKPLEVVRGGQGHVEVRLSFEEGLHLTEGVSSRCQIRAEDYHSSTLLHNTDPTKVKLETLEEPVRFAFTVPDDTSGDSTEKHSKRDYELEVECMVYYCDDGGVCMMKGVRFVVPVIEAQEESNKCLLEYRISRN